MKFDFRNKVVLITGGTSGIGKQLVSDFLKLGPHILLKYSRYKK